MEPQKIDEEHSEQAERQPTIVVDGDYTADYRSSSVSAAAAAGSSNDNDREGPSPPLSPCSSSNAKRLKRDRDICVGTHLQSQSRSQEEGAARCRLLLSRDGAEHTTVPNLKFPTPPPIFHPTHQANNSPIENQNCNAVNQNIMANSSPDYIASAIFPLAEIAPLRSLPLRRDFEPHICKYYNLQFPSGQALGGHIGCHPEASRSLAKGMTTSVDTVAPAALNSTTTTTTTAAAPAVNSTITTIADAASATANTFTTKAGTCSNEVNAIEPGSSTLNLLHNSSYLNKIINIAPEPPIDMDGSCLRLWHSDPESSEPEWDSQHKRNMDLGEEGSPTLPLLYNSSYLNKVINDAPKEPPIDMDGSWLRLWYSDVESSEPGWDTQPKRNMDLGEEGGLTLPLLYNSSYLNKVINITPREPPIDMDGSWLRLWYPDAESSKPGWDTQPKRNMDHGKEGWPTLPLLYNSSHLNKVINIAPESSIDMDGSRLRLWYSDAESLEPGWDKQPKRNLDLVEEVGQNRKRQ